MSLALIPCFASYICECACCVGTQCFCNIIETSLSNAVRFAHTLILILTLTLAVLLGTTFVDNMKSINGYSNMFGYGYEIEKLCVDPSTAVVSDDCIYSQLVYRSTLSLFILFSSLALLSVCFEYLNKSFWILKLGTTIGLFISFWWTSNEVFDDWAEGTKFISFLWLLAQGIILIDFSYDVHDVIISKAQESGSAWWYGGYLVLCCFLLLQTGMLTANMYSDYASCGPTSTWFITITLIMGLITTGVSLLSTVNKGLLTPCILFMYTTLMCWYSLLSIPPSFCDKDVSQLSTGDGTAMTVMLITTVIIILYCILNGSFILNVFNPDAEEGVIHSYSKTSTSSLVQMTSMSSPTTNLIDREGGDRNGSSSGLGSVDDIPDTGPSGSRHERVFFMVLMALTACYSGMLLTNWGTIGAMTNGNGSSASNSDGGTSMWLKILSQWILICLQCRVLHVAHMSNE